MRPLPIAAAIGLLTGWTVLAGEPFPPASTEIQQLRQKASAHFGQGDFARAEVIFRKLVTKAPGDVWALRNLGVVLFRRDKFAESEEQFKKALGIAPGDGFSHSTLGIVYYAQGRHELARQSLEKAIHIDPKNPVTHNYLGINASRLGSNDEAIEELKTAIALDNVYSDAYFNLAVVLVTKAKPEPETARGYYERALKLGAEPDDVLEQFLGWVDENGIRTAGKALTPQDVERLRGLLFARR